MLRAQIDNDRDWFGGSGIEEVTFGPLPFAEHRTFAKPSHVKDRKGFDMTYIGSTRVVDQASAHSLPLTVAGRHIALAVAGPSSGAFLPASLMYFCSGEPMHFLSGVDIISLNPTDSTHGNQNPLDLNSPF